MEEAKSSLQWPSLSLRLRTGGSLSMTLWTPACWLQTTWRVQGRSLNRCSLSLTSRNSVVCPLWTSPHLAHLPCSKHCLFFSACTLLNEFPDPRLLFIYPPVHTYGRAVNQLLFSISLSISTSGFYCVTSWHGNGQSAYSLQNPQHHHPWHSGRSCPAHWPLVHSPAMEETTTMLPLVCFSMGKAAVLRTT